MVSRNFSYVIVKMLFYGPWWREKQTIDTWIRYPGDTMGGAS